MNAAFKLLQEMPYYTGTTNQIFDLELEKYAEDVDGLRARIQKIFAGEPVTDKYGSVIQLKDPADKNSFLDFLLFSHQIQVYLRAAESNLEDLLTPLDSKVAPGPAYTAAETPKGAPPSDIGRWKRAHV